MIHFTCNYLSVLVQWTLGDIFGRVSLSEVQLLFTCVESAGTSAFAKNVAIEMVQIDCHRSGLRGFFLSHGKHITGLFEGSVTLVLNQMEKLVLSPHFEKITVILEYSPKTRICQCWYANYKIPADVDVRAFLSPEYLAEFVNSALKPLEMSRRQ